MKKLLRMLCLLLTMTLILITISFADKANDKGLIDQVINSYFNLQLEYVKDKEPGKAERLANVINTHIDSGKKIYEYEKGKAKFLIASHKNDNTIIENYSYRVEYISTDINENVATVHMKFYPSIKYNFLDYVSDDSISHEISLIKENGNWRIYNDFYTTEFKNTYGFDTNFDELEKNAKSEYEKYLENVKTEENSKSSEFIINSVPGDYYVTYDTTARNNAVNYAKSYTENSGDNTTDKYNFTQFNDYAPSDCQNYVSQSIWYGLGGRNSSNEDLPMTGSWWANKTGTATTWNWTSCDNFYSYITSNEATDYYGVHGSNSSISIMKIGDYVFSDVSSDDDHVMFITKIIDSNSNGLTEWDEIYISAHTSNRLDKNLKALYGGVSTPPSNFKFVMLRHFKWNSGQ